MTRCNRIPAPAALIAAFLLITAGVAQAAVPDRVLVQNGPHALTDLTLDGKSYGARPKFGWLLFSTTPGAHHLTAKDDAGRTLEADLAFAPETAFETPKVRAWCVLIDDAVNLVTHKDACGRVLLMLKPDLAPN